MSGDQAEEAALPPAILRRLLDAIAACEAWWHVDTFEAIGPHLSCYEVEALRDLFVAVGLDEYAGPLMEGHAEDDEEGDVHYRAPT